MKTVGEFKKAGLVFVGDDNLRSETNNHDSDEICMNRCWLGHGSYSGFLEVSDCYFANKEWVISSFAWRENTGVKPEFKGVLELQLLDGSICLSSDYKTICYNIDGHVKSVVKWRPILNQPSIFEPDNKESAIHKAWVDLSGNVKAISERWKTLWHVKDGYYINGEYYHSFSDKCEETGAKFICTKQEFTSYCEKMAAEEKRMDIIGQNGNDGLHYDSTAQQVKVIVNNNTPFSIELAEKGGFSYEFKAESGDKPIFTQAMADSGELPPVGAKAKVCIEKAGFDIDNSDLKFEGKVVIIRAAFANEEGEKIVAIENEDGNCACFIIECIEPLDTRTDREKAIDGCLNLMVKPCNLDSMRMTLGAAYDAGLIKW